MREMPSIASASYATSCVDASSFFTEQARSANARATNGIAEYAEYLDSARLFNAASNVANNMSDSQRSTPPVANRRLVQVFIADSNENVPLEQSLLYSGEQKLTDATDQELFFEIDIKGILEKHNEKRVKIVDKKVKERTEYLEPAKIRDLKMVVVNVASF
jgi:hypothetical protein